MRMKFQEPRCLLQHDPRSVRSLEQLKNLVIGNHFLSTRSGQKLKLSPLNLSVVSMVRQGVTARFEIAVCRQVLFFCVSLPVSSSITGHPCALVSSFYVSYSNFQIPHSTCGIIISHHQIMLISKFKKLSFKVHSYTRSSPESTIFIPYYIYTDPAPIQVQRGWTEERKIKVESQAAVEARWLARARAAASGRRFVFGEGGKFTEN